MCPEWQFLKRQCVASTDRGYSVIADSVSSPGGQREAPVGRGEGLRRAMEQPWPGCRLFGGQRIAGRSGNPCPPAGGAVSVSYVLIEAEFDAAMIERFDPAGLPAHWRESPRPWRLSGLAMPGWPARRRPSCKSPVPWCPWIGTICSIRLTRTSGGSRSGRRRRSHWTLAWSRRRHREAGGGRASLAVRTRGRRRRRRRCWLGGLPARGRGWGRA